MPDPIVFISHSAVKEGKLEAFHELSRQMFPVLEADKPGTVLQFGYVNEAGTEVHFVHVFPDAEAMDAHMLGAAERSGDAYEFIEPLGFEIYGTPSEEALSMLRQAPVDIVVRPRALGGFIRLGNR